MYKFKRVVTTMGGSGKVYRKGDIVPGYFTAPQEMVKAGDIEEVIDEQEIAEQIIEPIAEQPEPIEPVKRGRSKK
jgi:Asp-tRNA(Asn)/Glu-tRNA(Gln) amidotransferase B subunit